MKNQLGYNQPNNDCGWVLPIFCQLAFRYSAHRMSGETILGVINNAAFLMALVLLYESLPMHRNTSKPTQQMPVSYTHLRAHET
ncbi:MAG: hypothetical protein N3D16_04125, partial [Anaerolineales bacterium]|nr:hypothetical protein [Anaerolineales bacterium]